MKAITKASRLNTALQVIQHMNKGMTVVEACQTVGIPRSSFYYIVQNNPEAIAEFQAIIDASNREQLGLIVMSKNELLRRVIEAGLSGDTSPRDRLAIYSTLQKLTDQATKAQKSLNENEQRALEFLKQGPRLAQAKSRIATETTVTVRHEVEFGQSQTE